MTNSSSRPRLLDHQRDDVDWIGRVKRGLLGNEPGTGKSRSAIEAFDGGKNLVIAPSLVIESGNWSDQLEAWSDFPERWTVVPYSMLNEREWTGALKAGWPKIGPAEVPNFSATRPKGETNRWGNPIKTTVRPEFDQHWDAVVVDEAHYTKGRSSWWTLATQQIAAKSDALLEMTGTPIPNWAPEMFTLLQAIYPEETKAGRQFGSYWRWVEDWFVVTPSRFHAHSKEVGDLLACRKACFLRPPYDPCEHYFEFARANLGDRFRRVLREDCLDLPPLTEVEVYTRMDKDQARMYREMKRDFGTTIDGDEIVSWSQGSKNTNLDRLTTSPWVINPKGPAKGGKFERLRYDLESRARPTLVVAHYRTSVEGCADIARQVGARAAYVHGGLTKEEAGRRIQAFKRGDLDVLAGSLEMVSEGLNLTRADMTIFVEKSYKPSRNTQALYRTHRMGQTNPVTALDYVTPNSVDSKKRSLLAVKTDRQMRMMSAAQFNALL